MDEIKSWLSDNGFKFKTKYLRLYVELFSGKHTLLITHFKNDKYKSEIIFNVLSYRKEDIEDFDEFNTNKSNQIKYVEGYVSADEGFKQISEHCNVFFEMFAKDGTLCIRHVKSNETFYNVWEGVSDRVHICDNVDDLAKRIIHVNNTLK